MQQIFNGVFNHYPAHKAPFLHAQFTDWQNSKPLQNLRVLHHVPVVRNSLLKIANLIAAGAEVTVTNPDFMQACPETVAALAAENIQYVSDLTSLTHTHFDIYLDCGAALYKALGAPRIGAVELTRSGHEAYEKLAPDFPIISIDNSLTKQLETVFGMADSTLLALNTLTANAENFNNWLVFGFGKIGRGVAYFCQQQGIQITVVDNHPAALQQARLLGVNAIDGQDVAAVKTALQAADLIITATGGRDVLINYDKAWFQHKTLANLGILDEFGPRFSDDEVLFSKQPINFVLPDPTTIEYIDPEMYVHNQAVLFLLNNKPAPGMHGLPSVFDREIIQRWCQYHGNDMQVIDRWFIPFQSIS